MREVYEAVESDETERFVAWVYCHPYKFGWVKSYAAMNLEVSLDPQDAKGFFAPAAGRLFRDCQNFGIACTLFCKATPARKEDS